VQQLFSDVQNITILTSQITLNTNIFTSIKVIKNTHAHIYTDTRVILNAELIEQCILDTNAGQQQS
jgi:hypothetical protein